MHSKSFMAPKGVASSHAAEIIGIISSKHNIVFIGREQAKIVNIKNVKAGHFIVPL